jgi:hypothetical protein
LSRAVAFSSRSTCWSGGNPARGPDCRLGQGGRHDAASSSLYHRRIRGLARSSACGLDAAPGDSDFSTRWRLIKNRFAKELPKRERLSAVRKARGERGIRQRRFWEHLIRDEADYARHVEYCYIQSGQAPMGHACPRLAVFVVSS